MAKNENLCRDAELDKNYSVWNILSFYSMEIAPRSSTGMIGAFYYFFYAMVVGLDIWLIGLAYMIYGIWDAINDPLVGVISDKTYKFTRKWGKRFPWILLGVPGTLVTFVLLWIPPMGAADWMQFAWLLGILILQEMFYTISSSAKLALFSEKFVSAKDRAKAGGWSSVSYLIGFFLGSFLPGMLLNEAETNPTLYLTTALFLCIPGVIFSLLGIPGCREDNDMIDKAIRCAEKQPQLKFFQSMKVVFKNKHMLSILAVATFDNVASGILVPALTFWCLHTLEIGVMWMGIFTLTNFLMAIVGSTFWVWLAKRIGNKKTRFIGDMGMAVGYLAFLLPRAGPTAIPLGLVASTILGLNWGVYFVTNTPILGDVIDSITLDTKSRQAGVYSGMFILIERLGLVIAPLIMSAVFIIAGIDSDIELSFSTPQAAEAYRALVSWIPAILVITFNLVFWKMYQLDKTKVEDIKLELARLGI